MEIKLVIADPKTGKCFSKEVKEDAKRFSGMKIGDTVKGELMDMTGYEFLITGGSDHAGFPMRRDVTGTARKKILAVSGVGISKQKRKGMKQRRNVAGNTIYDKTAHVNLKITKYGKQPLPFQEGKEASDKKQGEAEA